MLSCITWLKDLPSQAAAAPAGFGVFDDNSGKDNGRNRSWPPREGSEQDRKRKRRRSQWVKSRERKNATSMMKLPLRGDKNTVSSMKFFHICIYIYANREGKSALVLLQWWKWTDVVALISQRWFSSFLPTHPPSLSLRSCVRVSALCRLYIVSKIMMECRKNILFQKLKYGPGLWDCMSSFVYVQFLTGQNPP